MTTTRNAAPRPMMTIITDSVAHADHAHTQLFRHRPHRGGRNLNGIRCLSVFARVT